MFSKIFKKDDLPDNATAPAPQAPAEKPDPAPWQAKLAAAGSDEAALLALANEAPIIDIKLAAVAALHSEDALKRAEKEFRDHDRRVHREAKRRFEDKVAERETRAKAETLIATATALGAEANVPANRLVELDHAWQALAHTHLTAEAIAQYDAAWSLLSGLARSRGDAQLKLSRWLTDARGAATRLVAACAAAAPGLAESAAPMMSDALAAVEAALADAPVELPTPLPKGANPEEVRAALVAARELADAVSSRLAFLAALPPAAPPALARPATAGPPDPADTAATAVSADPATAWRALPPVAHTAIAKTLDASFGAWQQGLSSARAADAAQRAQVEREAGAAERAARRSALNALLDTAEAQLAEGHSGETVAQLATVETMLKGLPPDRKQQVRIDAIQAELARLKGWQQWGGGRARDDLAVEAEALAKAATGEKLALKAHAEAIEKLRVRWKELDRLGGATNRPLWLRFENALKAAYVPITEQQAKLKAAREENLAVRKRLLDALDAVPLTTATTTTVATSAVPAATAADATTKNAGAAETADAAAVAAGAEEAVGAAIGAEGAENAEGAGGAETRMHNDAASGGEVDAEAHAKVDPKDEPKADPGEDTGHAAQDEAKEHASDGADAAAEKGAVDERAGRSGKDANDRKSGKGEKGGKDTRGGRAEAGARGDKSGKQESAGTEPDWKAVARSIEHFQTEWRKLGPIEHTVPKKAHDKLIARMRASLDRLETPLGETRRVAQLQREKLVEQAKALSADAKQRDALPKVRDLQAKWQQQAKQLPLDRRAENQLWQQFKAATDAVFAAREAAHAARAGEWNANQAAREALIARLNALQADTPPAELKRTLSDVDTGWRKAGEASRNVAAKLDGAFRSARERAQKHLAGSAQRAWHGTCDAIVAKLGLCEELDSGGARDELEIRWQALPALPAAWEKSLMARFQHQAAAPAAVAANTAARDDCLLQLESALGLSSPAAFQEARRLAKLLMMKNALEGKAAPVKTASDVTSLLATALAAAYPESAAKERLQRILAALREHPQH